MTLEQAKDWLRARFEKGAACPCCNQFAKLYKRKLNCGMARTLIEVYHAFRADPALEWLDVTYYLRERKIIAANSNTALLRHWGLIERKTDDAPKSGAKISGLYRATELGRAFVIGQASVPMYIYIYNDALVKRSDPDPARITIREALGNKFDYDELMRETPDGTVASSEPV